MSITLTALITEVQARCNALTGSSTIDEVLEVAIAAKKVEQAGGSITRTTLDTELQRVVDLSGGGSQIEDLIALAAANESTSTPPVPGGNTSLPVGSQTFVSTFTPPLLTMSDGSQWLRSGVLLENDDTFTEAETVEHLHVFGSQRLSHVFTYASTDRDDLVVSNGAGTIVAINLSSQPISVSTDNGVTWGAPVVPPTGALCGIAWCGDRFIVATTTHFWYSFNGLNWTQGASYVSTSWSGVRKLVWNGSFALLVSFFTTVQTNLASVRTTDGTTATTNSNHTATGTLTNNFTVVALGDTIFFGEPSVYAARYDNTSHTWFHLQPGGLSHAMGFAKSGSRILALQGVTGITRYSDDNGNTWVVIPASPSATELTRIGYQPNRLVGSGTRIYAATTQNLPYLAYTDDVGQSWKVMQVRERVYALYLRQTNLVLVSGAACIRLNLDSPSCFGLVSEIAPPDSNTVLAVRVK